MSWQPLVGHESVLKQLRHALARQRLGHAFLFVGPEGVGKRRMARHVAQGLLCETRDPKTLDPCGYCAGCRQVENRSHPDYFEVGKPADKHQLPIETMQELTGSLSLKPARGKHKIAVVDDADFLNEESANCFLKTLEEPPPGSLLILLATSAETQLTTIVSRCQVLRFGLLPFDDLVRLLMRLGVADSQSEAKKLAEWGAGSVGQAVELSRSEWTEARDQLLRGLLENPIRVVPLASMAQKFIGEAGREAASKRARARLVIRLVADFYRACLVYQQGVQSASPDATKIEQLAGRLDSDTFIDLIERCLQADYHIGRFLNQQLAVDCWLDDLAQIASGQFIRRVG